MNYLLLLIVKRVSVCLFVILQFFLFVLNKMKENESRLFTMGEKNPVEKQTKKKEKRKEINKNPANFFILVSSLSKRTKKQK